MSCITEILKLKGDQEALLPLDEKGEPWVAVEGGGVYKEYEYLIVLNHRGHRCGYVALPPEHRANNVGNRIAAYSNLPEIDYMNLDIECHGGLTFGGNHHSLKDLLSVPCSDNWIGFDCGHHGDRSDIESFSKYFGEEKAEKNKKYFDLIDDYPNSEVRTFNYAEQECKSIIEQLIKQAA